MTDCYCPECYAPSSHTGTAFYMGDGTEIERYQCKNGHRWKNINGRKEVDRAS